METTPPPPTHFRCRRPEISREARISDLALPLPLMAPGGAGGVFSSRQDLLLLLGAGEGELGLEGLLLLLLQRSAREAGARHLGSKN